MKSRINIGVMGSLLALLALSLPCSVAAAQANSTSDTEPRCTPADAGSGSKQALSNCGPDTAERAVPYARKPH